MWFNSVVTYMTQQCSESSPQLIFKDSLSGSLAKPNRSAYIELVYLSECKQWLTLLSMQIELVLKEPLRRSQRGGDDMIQNTDLLIITWVAHSNKRIHIEIQMLCRWFQAEWNSFKWNYHKTCTECRSLLSETVQNTLHTCESTK